MDKRLKKQWLDALRSDDYEQGTGDFIQKETEYSTDNGEPEKVEVGYCCLGVLADVVGFPDGFINNNALLPPAYCDFLGLPTDVQEDVAEMNDEGHTFEEIADYLEVVL